ncbi:hypothetical protein Tco_1047637 [Tanacetum coccineum]
MDKEGIVLGHKILKSRIEVNRAKVDVIAKLPHPTSVKEEAENSRPDHLSRLENPHQGDLEKKEINETFPLKTLGMLTFHGDSSTPWFADIANYHAGNFIVKGMSSQQKKKYSLRIQGNLTEDICDVPSCDNDHFDAKCGLINSLLSRDIPITSPNIDFLPKEFAGELDFIDPILPGINKDDFDEEEGEIDIDIFQIKNEILREKLLNVKLLIDKIEALKLTPSIPFVLKNPSSSPIPVVDSDFRIEEVDTFIVPEDSIPPGIESDFDSEEDIIFLDNLLNDDPIPEYERFTFDIEPDAPVINNFDELNEDECFDPGGGEIDVSQNIEDNDSFTFVIWIFIPYRTYPEVSPLLISTGSEDTIFDPGIST